MDTQIPTTVSSHAFHPDFQAPELGGNPGLHHMLPHCCGAGDALSTMLSESLFPQALHSPNHPLLEWGQASEHLTIISPRIS